MPCLVFTGHPSAGKTTLAELFAQRAKEVHNLKTIIINEAVACPDFSQSECYSSSQSEKKTRGALKSSFDRAVAHSSDTLVILDSLNYIKGFRYELYCICKSAGDLYGVVWVMNDLEVIREWNCSREEKGYPLELLAELIQRYEPPDSRNRWDQPLYRVDARPTERRSQRPLAQDVLEKSVYNMHKLSDAISSVDKAVEKKAVKTSTFKRACFKRPASGTSPESFVPAINTPRQQTEDARQQEKLAEVSLKERVDQILHSFLNEKPLTKNVSTIPQLASSSDTLHNVDSVTRQVTSLLTKEFNKRASGKFFIDLDQGSQKLEFECTQRMSSIELSRLRRQYVQWTANHPSDETAAGIAKAFLDYMKIHR